ncbi:MAG: LD-carboxypeptidase [Anaerolineaceae bacterium]|nr:LD-carboxypeptidase [Anaerolineaceae bacterium]
MIKPPCLKPGDTIGLISPSWPAAARYPHRVENGMAALRSLGYQVKIAPHALNDRGYVSDTPANRAADIHALFADGEVAMVLAAIGGNHSCHLLPRLDYDLIRHNPKIFMGYSDVTVLNMAILARTGLVTFNGPALITDFAEYPSMLAYTLQNFLAVCANPAPAGDVHPAVEWTEEHQDWKTRADLERGREMLPSSGWTWLKPGQGQGRLVGGCIESLQHVRGTRYWPDMEGAILFLETSEDCPPPEDVDALLMDLENMGVLEGLRGLLFGRPMSYTTAQKQELREIILERSLPFDYPIITDMDFGHTSPQMTLPLGVMASMNSDRQCFEIVEAAVI